MYAGSVSLVSSPPLCGSKQILASVPVKSKPAAVLADSSAASISDSKFRSPEACCASASPIPRMASVAMISTRLRFMTPPWISGCSLFSLHLFHLLAHDLGRGPLSLLLGATNLSAAFLHQQPGDFLVLAID